MDPNTTARRRAHDLAKQQLQRRKADGQDVTYWSARVKQAGQQLALAARDLHAGSRLTTVRRPRGRGRQSAGRPAARRRRFDSPRDDPGPGPEPPLAGRPSKGTSS